MKLSEIAERLGLSTAVAGKGLQSEVSGGYCSDLLSDVMAGAKENSVWVTIQTHQNVVAVAALTSVAGVIVTGGHQPDQDTLARATQEGVTILLTPMHSFETVGRIYALLGSG